MSSTGEGGRALGLLVMRVGVGVMFIAHGVPKLAGGLEQWTGLGKAVAAFGLDFAPAFWGFLAAFSEAGGGLLLLLGLLTRPATFLLTCTMVVAASFHLRRGDGLGGASHALEMAIVFASLFLIGPGRYSLDAWLGRRLAGTAFARLLGAPSTGPTT